MFTENRVRINELIDKASLVLIGLLLLFFPLVFTFQTTDIFALPKQAFLGAVTLTVLLLFGLKSLLNNKVVIRRNPFDLPVFLFTVAVLLSSIFAVNKADSFITFVPFLFAVFAYFVIVNTAKTKTGVLFLLCALILGGLITSVVALLAFLKIYPLPLAQTHAQTFAVLGSLLDQALYLAFVLPLAAYLTYPFLAAYKSKHKESNELETASKSDIVKLAGFGISTIIILVGLLVTIYELIYLQKPLLLPLETGFQTAFAAISQDANRVIQGFLFGSGFGNYGVVFSRFKQAAFNLDPTLWSFTFFRSSSYILELLATTGILGLLSFLFLIYKIVKERPVFVPLILIIAAGFVLPFSFTIQALFFLLLGLFAAVQGLEEHHQHRFFDVELQLVALKKGIISLLPTEEETRTPASPNRGERQDALSRLLPGFIFVIITALVLGLGFVSARYVLSNIKFQESLVAASQNNGSLTYSYRKEAIALFSFSAAYYRLFAQTNLSLANSLASSIKPGSTPSQDTTQTIYTLIQQAINSGRTATTIAPQSAADWQNLSSIYRSLIGFGQNADSFAILSAQQAVTLDPTSPQEYINLGGIYYQLGAWDKAEQQFQQAVNLKPDFPNAYYNLGYTLMQKGDLKGALAQFETVKTLVANDPANTAKITGEIKELQAKIGAQAQGTSPTDNAAKTENPLNVNAPSPTLPPQNPPVKIPGPQVSPTATPTPTPASNAAEATAAP